MTKQDVLAVKEHTYMNRMFFNPENSAVVCADHNERLFGGKLKPRNFSRNAGCLYCAKPEEVAKLQHSSVESQEDIPEE